MTEVSFLRSRNQASPSPSGKGTSCLSVLLKPWMSRTAKMGLLVRPIQSPNSPVPCPANSGPMITGSRSKDTARFSTQWILRRLAPRPSFGSSFANSMYRLWGSPDHVRHSPCHSSRLAQRLDGLIASPESPSSCIVLFGENVVYGDPLLSRDSEHVE